jgi:hypothetical protein
VYHHGKMKNPYKVLDEEFVDNRRTGRPRLKRNNIKIIPE